MTDDIDKGDTMNTAYKVLSQDGLPVHGGSGAYHLPKGERPGEWMPAIDPVMYKQGYHLFLDASDMLHLLDGHVWLCGYRGEVIEGDDKICVEQVRLLRKVIGDKELRLFACDCAEHVLPLHEDWHPDDTRPRAAIEAARRYATGACSEGELDAAGEAARDAAGAATSEAWNAAAWAAREAARAAAGAATREACNAASWAARGAAGAARDAAREAAWAAREAARAAAGAATREACRAAAWSAERNWQIERLREYLEGEVRR